MVKVPAALPAEHRRPLLMTRSLSGSGLGLRREMLPVLQQADLSVIDFFEVAPENWINLGGRYAADLRHYSERFPLVCHGLSLSLGGSDPLDFDLLRNIRQFMREHGVTLYTEHLSWCGHDGHLYDLLPLPFNEAVARWVADRIRQAQDALGRRIAIENSSYYFLPPGSDMSESEFIGQVVSLADCDLHLDVNNLYVNSRNLGYDADDFLHSIPRERICYIHVAGHYTEPDGWMVDTHGTAVIDDVWRLLQLTYQLTGRPLPTCLERDFNFPAFAELQGELRTIRQLQSGNAIAADHTVAR